MGRRTSFSATTRSTPSRSSPRRKIRCASISSAQPAALALAEDTHANQFSVRLDNEMSDRQRLFGRYTYDRNIADDLQDVPRAGFNQPIDQKGQNLTVGHTWIASNRTVNEARFGLSRRERGL